MPKSQEMIERKVDCKAPREKLKYLAKAIRSTYAYISLHKKQEKGEENLTPRSKITTLCSSVSSSDRFLILAYVIIQAKVSLWSHYCFLVDFMRTEGERSEFILSLNELGKALMFISELNCNLVDENGSYISFVILTMSIKVALREARDKFNSVELRDQILIFKKFCKILRRIGSFEASVFYRENIANGDSNCADESHPDVLTFMKEDKRKTLVQNFQFLLLLFRSIGMNLVLVGEKKEGMEEINQSTQVPQIILHFHVKYSLATYLSLAEFCSEISLNNSYFASGMWLDLENDLHIKTNKLQYFGRKHDV